MCARIYLLVIDSCIGSHCALVDTPKPIVSKMYHWTSKLVEQVAETLETTQATRKKDVMDIIDTRRAQLLHGDFHAAAHALDPEYLSYDRSDCFEPLLNMVDKLAPTKVGGQICALQHW